MKTWLASVILATLVGCKHPSPPPAAVTDGPMELSSMLQSALPSVVLIINSRPNGTHGWGTGLLVDNAGHVLTNLHVVANAQTLGVMLYDPDRTSYAATDGGLSRYVFQYRGDILPAQIKHGDPVVDLAMIKVQGDIPERPLIKWRDDPVPVGTRVLALGHPEENMWSFSAGIVSSLHHGVIQHDTPINKGNSGGPLVDAEGRLVGINTWKLFGDAEGVSYARPVDVLRRMQPGQQSHEHTERLDLSTPQKALMKCLGALELSSVQAVGCTDWRGVADAIVGAVRHQLENSDHDPKMVKQVIGRLKSSEALSPPRMHAHFVKLYQSPSADEKLRMLGTLMGGVLIRQTDMDLAAQPQLTTQSYTPSIDDDLLMEHGLKLDLANPAAFLDVLRMGYRVDATESLSPDRVWLKVSGRNLDGSEYWFSQLTVRHNNSWHLSITPTAQDLAALPKGWFPPFSTMKSVQAAHADTAEIKLGKPAKP